MIDPSLDELLELVDSKYSLVVVVAKRAREIMERQEEEGRDNPVTQAIGQLSGGDLRYYRTRIGIK